LHVAGQFAVVTALPELVTTPAYRLIAQQTGISVAEVLQEITAISLPEETARLLQVPVGSPGLHIRRRFLASDGTLLESTDNFHAAAGRFAYSLHLGAPDGEG
jgi:GntR family transcriptional regulator